MIKSIVFFRRKPGMTVEEFRRYWLEEHPTVVTQLPGVRRYVQSHPTMSAYDGGRQPDYDGVAEVWWDDWESLRASGRGPAWQAVAADEANFIDPESRRLLVTEEHVIVEG
jgi:uncharacterized protein (TIGR02118 family)